MTDTDDVVRFDPDNARDHPERNRALIRESLAAVGGFRSIAIDGDNTVRAGNGVLREAQAMGFVLRIVDAAPNEIIGVRRRDLVGDQARLAGLYDNRTAETSLWNVAALERLGTDLGVVDATTLWTPEEWSMVMDPDSLSEEPPAGYVLPEHDDAQGPARLSGRGTVALQERTDDDEKFPVSVVLTRQEYEVWVKAKARLGQAQGRALRDKEAFWLLITGDLPE